MAFGNDPFRISGAVEGTYMVSPEMTGVADEAGIPHEFTAFQRGYMEARAAANGYVFVEDPALNPVLDTALDFERGEDIEATVKRGN